MFSSLSKNKCIIKAAISLLLVNALVSLNCNLSCRKSSVKYQDPEDRSFFIVLSRLFPSDSLFRIRQVSSTGADKADIEIEYFDIPSLEQFTDEPVATEYEKVRVASFSKREIS